MQFGCAAIPYFSSWCFLQTEFAGERTLPPLIVISGTSVVCASRKARRAGVQVGMPAERARGLFEQEPLIRRRRPVREAAAWEQLLDTLYQLTPRIEAIRPGEAFFEPHGEPAAYRALADRYRLHLALATSRSIARLGAARAATGHTLQIGRRDETAFLRRYATQRLTRLGFTEDTVERLALFGLTHLAHLRRLSRRHLSDQFGEEGERLYGILHPPRSPRRIGPYRQPPALRETYEFDFPERSPDAAATALEQLLDTISERLQGRAAGRMQLSFLLSSEGERRTGHLFREATGDAREIARRSRRLLDELLTSANLAARPLTALRLELGALSTPERRQGGLFFERPALARAVKAVSRRYPNALRRIETDAHALFPEDQMQLVPLDGPEEA